MKNYLANYKKIISTEIAYMEKKITNPNFWRSSWKEKKFWVLVIPCLWPLISFFPPWLHLLPVYFAQCLKAAFDMLICITKIVGDELSVSKLPFSILQCFPGGIFFFFVSRIPRKLVHVTCVLILFLINFVGVFSSVYCWNT